MAAYDLNMSEIKNKINGLKKTSQKTPRLNRIKLSDAELEQVAGGLWRKQGYTRDFWVECPNCKCSLRSQVTGWKNDLTETDYFYCSKCGTVWGITGDGYLCI